MNHDWDKNYRCCKLCNLAATEFVNSHYQAPCLANPEPQWRSCETPPSKPGWHKRRCDGIEIIDERYWDGSRWLYDVGHPMLLKQDGFWLDAPSADQGEPAVQTGGTAYGAHVPQPVQSGSRQNAAQEEGSTANHSVAGAVQGGSATPLRAASLAQQKADIQAELVALRADNRAFVGTYTHTRRFGERE